VAFTGISRRLWAGGHNYQWNLFTALNRHAPGTITPVLFAGTSDASDEIASLADIPGVEIVESPAFDRRGARLLGALAYGIDRSAAAEFRARHIDIVFESARFFGWRLPFPAIAWFPDFQHRQLPSLFSTAARWRRDLGFRAQIASGRHIMVSSESARVDLRKFYPDLTNEVSVVRFASEPSSDLLAADPFDVIGHYGLPLRYFYLPNQFWRHKNHQLVVEALAVLKQRGVDTVVAATGGAYDPREPAYFEAVMREVKARGIEANFRHLGMIRMDHVYALLRASTALINPSRCEGWSTTVEEAKSFRVPLILSDLYVHREQAGGSARYFDVDNPVALANHMLDLSQTSGSVIARDLMPDLDRRVQAFVGDFIRLAHDAKLPAR
jgi:glycosyltransferase involved in cell wall biosynthesis